MKLLQSKTAVPSNYLQTKIEKSTSSSDNENKIPTNESLRGKSTRALRLMRAKRNGASSPSPILDTEPKQCFKSAKGVMEIKKSDNAASDTSSHSSLSNKELSEIATRALEISKNKIQNEPNETEKIPSSI